MIVEAHEEFIQHIEAGSSRLKALSITSMAVALFLLVSYLIQEVLPFTSGTTVVTVNLLDPTLVAVQTILILLAFAWLYVGLVNYLFARRLGGKIKQAREKEREIEKMITGETS
jgi:hypothetical protein